ncbi:MAG: VacJ family lipoprotein [Campylobacteraceae bacterium]|nr:VacJ family lipoprotein [Campylobacteraceae bacterium]
MIKKIFIFLLTLFLFAGCASKNEPSAYADSFQNGNVDEFDEFENEFAQNSGSSFDPLSGYNRVMTSFNHAAMTNVLIPVSKGYKKVVPEDARSAIGNFLYNILYPTRLVNNLLQGKFKNALDETGSFLLNTAVGFLGIANVAADIYKIEQHDEDFGQTLGYWGVPAGPHIVLPILGPSNLRDIGGKFVDTWSSPTSYVKQRDVNLVNTYFEEMSVSAVQGVNQLSFDYNAYEMITKDAIDLYPLLKSMYEQRREKLIKE